MRIALTLLASMVLLGNESMAMKTPSLTRWEQESIRWGKVRIEISVPRNMVRRETGNALMKHVFTDGEVRSQELLNRSFDYNPRFRIIPIEYGSIQLRMYIETIPGDDIAYVDEYGLGNYLLKHYEAAYDNPLVLGYGTYETRASRRVVDTGKLSWDVFQELKELPDSPLSEMSKHVFWCLRLDHNHYFLVLFEFINNVEVRKNFHKWYVNASRVELEIMRRIEVDGL